ncbi:MAG: NmrA family NAD(P)-binding protein [Bacteroidota bacterium]
MSDNILVIGSTGKTGNRVFSRLQQNNVDVRPASRNSDIPFDWHDDASWINALEGISTVYITFYPDIALPSSEAIIFNFAQAAKKAGVKKAVLLSGRGEPEAVACENVIRNSGMAWTIVRSSFFMQNFSEGMWAGDIAAKEFVIPTVKAKEPFVDIDDIADVVVETLTNSKHDGKVYEMTGPELLSFEEVISKLSLALQSQIHLKQVPIKEYRTILKEHQLPQDLIGLISYLLTEVMDGRNESMKHDIELVLNRKPGSFDNYIQKTIQAGFWQTN